MRRWIALAAKLYPPGWRARYESEFGALLEEAPADWRQLWNVTRAAVAMQVAVNREEFRIIGAAALAGIALAAVAAVRVPPRYVSSAVVRIDPMVTHGATVRPGVARREADERYDFLRANLQAGQQHVRQARTTIQERHAIGWYTPPEMDVWAAVEDPIRAGGEIQVEPVELAGAGGLGMRVSFASSNRREAQAAVEKLTPIMTYWNDAIENGRAAGPFPFPVSIRLDRAGAAGLPSAFAERRRSLLLAAGAGGGLLLGSLAAFFRRRRMLAVRLAAFGLAGCLFAAAVSLSISERYTATASFRFRTPRDPLGWTVAIPARPFQEQAPLAWNGVVGENDLWKNVQASFRIRGEVLEATVSHPDRTRAKQLVNRLTQDVASRYQMESQVGSHLLGIRMSPVEDVQRSHYRLELTMGGTLLGLLLAMRRPQRGPIPL